MKTLIKPVFTFAALLLFLAVSVPLKAQKKELNQNQIPQAIVRAIHTDFPSWDMNQTKWYTSGQETRNWTPLQGADHYVVEGTGRNYKVRAVYSKHGKLRYSKTTITDAPLPRAIMDKLDSEEEYKGWKVTGDQEVIRDFREDRKTYKVYLQRNGEKKSVYFDPMGNKVRRARLLGG
ncbi:hypothetical protein [Fodinibius sediminis]|uniref:Beta-lactamase-inhibitor-like, PepSY-like n=1 Tax=Fodinibius sediminis TaxID=1214077 RepID=A0A521BQY2_9BACT|nr:hypothetical protein [Fodinibius sediminis]SMO49161.1 hypothetical protein SAMN06265218_103292 [Fodinibius sediminis]